MGDISDMTNSTLVIKSDNRKTTSPKKKMTKFKPSFHPDYGKSDDTGYEGF